jgi:hypothetical protein
MNKNIELVSTSDSHALLYAEDRVISTPIKVPIVFSYNEAYSVILNEEHKSIILCLNTKTMSMCYITNILEAKEFYQEIHLD